MVPNIIVFVKQRNVLQKKLRRLSAKICLFTTGKHYSSAFVLAQRKHFPLGKQKCFILFWLWPKWCSFSTFHRLPVAVAYWHYAIQPASRSLSSPIRMLRKDGIKAMAAIAPRIPSINTAKGAELLWAAHPTSKLPTGCMP